MHHETCLTDSALPRGQWIQTGIELSLLIGVMLTVGAIQIPCHWTSIWMDREFTGWVAPIANQVAEGRTLYSSSGHSPMPPLPAIFMGLLMNGDANWYSESLLNFVCQSTIVILMFFALRRSYQRPIPFLASFVSLPIIYSLPKTIAYDGLVQVMVAATSIATGVAVGSAGPVRGTALIVSALVSALAILTKQSTATGIVIGSAIAYLAFMKRGRITSTAIYLTFVLAFFASLCGVITSYVDVPGMLSDVFRNSSEPKGGPRTILLNLMWYAIQSFERIGVLAIGAVSAVGLLKLSRRNDGILTMPTQRPVGLILVAMIIGPCALWVSQASGFVFAIQTTVLTNLAQTILWAGAVSLFVESCLIRRTPKNASTNEAAAIFVVLATSATFHSLSVNTFRWTYDNNPLIVFAFASFLSAAFYSAEVLRPNQIIFKVAGVAFVSMCAWSHYAMQYSNCRACTVAWPEIRHLDGAQLKPTSQGMRNLVEVVRRLAATDESVLLLPNDPNVEAWFERPKPKLSSTIVFVDQYFDRHVEEDVARLKENPPKLVIIGPRRFWRKFSNQWRTSTGCERLIDLVTAELLIDRYVPAESVAIHFGDGVDEMDVYIRRD